MVYTQEQLKRYSRQIAMEEVGIAGQEKLTAGRVLVIGAGGLGSAALMYLAAAGVGTLGIADYDRVELSNLERQILHRTSRLGVQKTASAAETLRDINPDLRLVSYPVRVTPENIPKMVLEYDIVLDCTDQFENKLLVNDACVAAQKPGGHQISPGPGGAADRPDAALRRHEDDRFRDGPPGKVALLQGLRHTRRCRDPALRAV